MRSHSFVETLMLEASLGIDAVTLPRRRPVRGLFQTVFSAEFRTLFGKRSTCGATLRRGEHGLAEDLLRRD